MAEPIEMPFGLWTCVGQGSMCYMEVQIGAIWRIRLNCPSAAAMRPFCQITVTAYYYYTMKVKNGFSWLQVLFQGDYGL